MTPGSGVALAAPVFGPAASPVPGAAFRVRYLNIAECVDTGRTGENCARTECRYHLAHREHWGHHLQPTRSCALDVANEGAHTLADVAAVLGVSAERVRQIEAAAIEHLKRNRTLKRLHHESK